jgi:hypothetical protein
MEATDALLPSAKGRSGRHYERQHLSGILLKYQHGGPSRQTTRRQMDLTRSRTIHNITYTFSLEKHHMSGVERSNNCGCNLDGRMQR